MATIKTPLYMAAHNGELEIVRELIVAGADVNKVGDSSMAGCLLWLRYVRDIQIL